MPQEVRMWEVTPENTLAEVTPSGINLEERLEDWLESDISMLDPNLLVIGRQVRTPFSGIIDLLCLDFDGGLVVVELKRDQTPRDVTAQVLDYASWVKNLRDDEIRGIADGYLNPGGSSLEAAFETKFEQPLPDPLNENHRSLIVSASTDAATERIVRYLSDLGVPINVATVQHFTNSSGQEMLAQVFLVDPEMVDEKSRSRSKGHPYSRTTASQLESLANEKGVGESYRRLSSGASSIGMRMAIPRNETRSFSVREGDSYLAAFVVDLDKSNLEQGLKFRLDVVTLMNYSGLDIEQINHILPEVKEDLPRSQWGGRKGEDWSGLQGYFRTGEEVDKFLNGLRAAAGQ